MKPVRAGKLPQLLLSVPTSKNRHLFSAWQIAFLVVLVLLIGAGAGTFFASFNLRPEMAPGTAITIPVTPSSSAGLVKFMVFSNNSFSILYPSNWKITQIRATPGSGNNVWFFGDSTTKFVVNTHDQNTDPSSIITHFMGNGIYCVVQTGAVPSVTVNSIVWQQTVKDCFFDGLTVVVDVLTHQNSQTPDQTFLLSSGLQDVGNLNLINFAQANRQYFQPMLQSFQAK